VKKKSQNRYRTEKGGGFIAALAIVAVVLLAIGAYYLFGVSDRQPEKQQVESARTSPGAASGSPQVTPPLPHKAPSSARKKPEYPAVESDLSSVLPEQTAKTEGKGRLAVIIDDMGTSLAEARSLAEIKVPLTFAIIPGLRNDRAVAAYAASKGIETMIHMPMQSKEWPKRRLESNGLLVSMSEEELRGQLNSYFNAVPKAVGANNHMGSEFTEHEGKMRSVLSVLKGRGMFFVDSVTSPRSVGSRIASEMGVKNGRRHVFLDNEQNSTYITSQINQAVKYAKRHGEAIAICHPHPVTIKTLAAVLPGLSSQGITLVTASKLVR